jgi:hypothetical protein
LQILYHCLSVVTADKALWQWRQPSFGKSRVHSVVLFQHNTKMFQYGIHMEDTEKNKWSWISQNTVQSNEKDETIISVIKRRFGEHITSRLVITQNRELFLRCIAYNMYRSTKLIIILMVFYWTKHYINIIIFKNSV